MNNMNFIDFQTKFSLKDFPLTIQMVEKNDYNNATVYYMTDTDGLAAISIFDEGKNYIRLDVLEVRKDCRNQKYGSKIINTLKKHNKEIFVRSLADAKHFYLNQGFTLTDKNSNTLELVCKM